MERLTDEGLIAIIWLSEQHDGYYKPYEEDHFEYKESIHDSAIDILEILKECRRREYPKDKKSMAGLMKRPKSSNKHMRIDYFIKIN